MSFNNLHSLITFNFIIYIKNFHQKRTKFNFNKIFKIFLNILHIILYIILIIFFIFLLTFLKLYLSFKI